MSDATKQDFYTIFVNRQTYFGMPVSIHAPAWGATEGFGFAVRMPVISIHAPAWGATQWHVGGGEAKDYFNPRTRVGCDKHSSDSYGGS